MLLYHGSRHGIDGPIAPLSRDRCDFGRGFYLGTEPLQPLTLICDFPDARFYTVELDLDGLDVRELSADATWALVVAYHRGKMEQARGTADEEYAYWLRHESYKQLAHTSKKQL